MKGALVWLGFAAPLGACAAASTDSAAPEPDPLRGRIVSVIDGDTIAVRTSSPSRSYTVRPIGIDTPETKRPGTPIECGGLAATAHMLELAYTHPSDSNGDGLLDNPGGRGRMLRLAADPTQDRYDRLLAYSPTSSRHEGPSSPSPRSQPATPTSTSTSTRGVSPATQSSRARRARRGLWGACGGEFHRPYQHRAQRPFVQGELH